MPVITSFVNIGIHCVKQYSFRLRIVRIVNHGVFCRADRLRNKACMGLSERINRAWVQSFFCQVRCELVRAKGHQGFNDGSSWAHYSPNLIVSPPWVHSELILCLVRAIIRLRQQHGLLANQTLWDCLNLFCWCNFLWVLVHHHHHG